MRLEEKLLNEFKAAQEDLVRGMLNVPAEDLMKHYIQVGVHRGLNQAIEILTEMIGSGEDE